MPEWLTTLLVGVVAASAGWATSFVQLRTGGYTRIRTLEQRVDRLETRNTLLWAYNRELGTHIVSEKPPPPPPIPAELLAAMEELK